MSALKADKFDLTHRQKNKIRWARLTQWEYWPMWIIHFPTLFVYPLLVIQHRALLFFSAANPSIEMGGLIGEAKSDIFSLTPDDHQPRWTLLSPAPTPIEIDQAIDYIRLPLVAKPNRGERGRMVKICRTTEQVHKHLLAHPVDFVLQAFAKGSLEASVMVARHPETNACKITSLTLKKFLHVTGDGVQTIEQLINLSPRALMQLKRLKREKPALLQQTPDKGKTIILEEIGNHSKGTTFLDGRQYISQEMENTFTKIITQMDGVYYGRFDLLCTNLDSLKTGNGIEVVELNGVGAEPAHIYQPGYPLFRAWRDILNHWLMISATARLNHKRGVQYMTIQQGRQHLAMLKRYNARAKS